MYQYSDDYRSVVEQMKFIARKEDLDVVDRRHLFLAIEFLYPGMFKRLLGGLDLMLPKEYTEWDVEALEHHRSVAISTELWKVIALEGGYLADAVDACGGPAVCTVDVVHLAAAYLLDPQEDSIHGYLLVEGVDNTSEDFRTNLFKRLKAEVEESENDRRQHEYKDTLLSVASIKRELRQRIVGQTKAIDTVSALLADFWTRPIDANSCPLSIFITGAHGSGKSKFAHELATLISDKLGGVSITNLDGGFYAGDNVARDVVGYDQTWKTPRASDFTSPISDCSKGIIIVDNIEAMHPNALNFVRRAITTGRLHDEYLGEDVNFRDAVCIFISSAGGEFVTADEVKKYGDNATISRQRLLEGLTVNAPLSVASALTTMLTRCSATVLMPPLSVAEMRKLTERNVKAAVAELGRFARKVHVDELGVVNLLIQSYPELNAGYVGSDVADVILAPVKKKIEDAPNLFGGFRAIDVSIMGVNDCSDEEVSKRMKARKRLGYKVDIKIEKGCRLCLTLTATGLVTLPAVQDGIITVGAASEKDSFASLVGVDRPKEYLQKWSSYFASHTQHALRPEHMLLSGKPGTGKTSVAKAAAAMMSLPYIVLNCTDLGSALAVRQVFAKIRKYGGEDGIVVMLDEIDSICEDRDGKSPDYIERLNTFLQEISGFNETSKALFIAATNRIESLDAAVTRCGRFGQTFTFGDLTGDERWRLVDMAVQELGQAALDDGMKAFIVETTQGFAPVTIKSILRDMFMAAEGKNPDQRSYLAARRRILNGVANSKNETLCEEELKQVAAHEAGHAVMHFLREPSRRFVQTTVMPADCDAWGYLERINDNSLIDHTKRGMENRIDVALAGCVAQELLSEPSDGGISDLEMATQFAMRYMRAGFSEEYGLAIADADNKSPIYLEQMRPHLNKMLAERRKIVKKDLEHNMDFLQRVTSALIEKSVLLYDEVAAIGKDTLGESNLNQTGGGNHV